MLKHTAVDFLPEKQFQSIHFPCLSHSHTHCTANSCTQAQLELQSDLRFRQSLFSFVMLRLLLPLQHFLLLSLNLQRVNMVGMGTELYRHSDILQTAMKLYQAVNERAEFNDSWQPSSQMQPLPTSASTACFLVSSCPAFSTLR